MEKKSENILGFLFVLFGLPLFYILANTYSKYSANNQTSLFDYLLMIIVGIGFYFLAIKLLKHQTQNIRHPYLSKVLRIAYTYLYVIFIFGIVYFKIYTNNPDSFAISSSIIEGKKKNELIEANYSELIGLNTNIFLLSKLSENADSAYFAFLNSKKLRKW